MSLSFSFAWKSLISSAGTRPSYSFGPRVHPPNLNGTANVLAAVCSDPSVHEPDLMPIFRCSGCSKERVQILRQTWQLVDSKLQDHPLPAVRDCLFIIFVAALNSERTRHVA
jgi:hypothetical protein